MSNRSSKPLIKACIRHTQFQLSLDLSPCTRWLRFAEVHYQRPSPSAEAPEISEVLLWFIHSVVSWPQMQQLVQCQQVEDGVCTPLLCVSIHATIKHSPAIVPPGNQAPGSGSMSAACIDR